MNHVNQTLYIPLYGKAYVSRKGLFLHDPKAVEIWEAEGFPLKGKSKSKWLAYYMGIRSAVFDEWLKQQLSKESDAVVIHLGCGMDSRILRVGTNGHRWYDVDFPEVIAERKRYFREEDDYQMLASDIRDLRWLDAVSGATHAIVVMEGVSMYLNNRELGDLMTALSDRFESIRLLMDCYTTLAAKLSKRANPVNDVGVTQVYGLDDPQLCQQPPLLYAKEHELTPRRYIENLRGIEKVIFSRLYAGKLSKKLYRLFEYRKN